MSHVQHQTINITSFDEDIIVECKKRIDSIGLLTTEMVESFCNTYWTFFIAPSGSKAGWPESESHLEKIKQAENIINSFAYEDGSNCIEYCLSIYGDSEG